MRVAFNSPARNQTLDSPGRPLRSRRRSEKPDTHVRLVPLAPIVTVAEWLRRQTVDLSTRVQFSPVTPSLGGRSAARTRVFEARYGSSSLPLPTRSITQPGRGRLLGRAGRNFLKVDVDGSSPSLASSFPRGRRSTDQDTRLRTGRLEVQILPPVPFSARRPKGEDTALRRLKFGFESREAGQFSRGGGREARHRIVDPDNASSILVRRANTFTGTWTRWISHRAFNAIIAGSNPVVPTKLL